MKTNTSKSNESQIRTCIITGEKHNKADMIRLVSYQGDKIQIDLSGKKPGRGANVSAKLENLEKLIDRNGAILARAFKKQVKPDEIEYLKQEFPKAVEEKLFRPRETKPVVVKIKKEEFTQKIHSIKD
jgi:predicted RNA-binding protein YlxR (DUF448 family)